MLTALLLLKVMQAVKETTWKASSDEKFQHTDLFIFQSYFTKAWPPGAPFSDMVQLQSWHEWVITFIIKHEMKLLIYSQASTLQLLEVWEWLHLALYWAYDYLPMLGWQLIHFINMGLRFSHLLSYSIFFKWFQISKCSYETININLWAIDGNSWDVVISMSENHSRWLFIWHRQCCKRLIN